MHKTVIKSLLFVISAALIFGNGQAIAKKDDGGSFAKHKLVLQISDDDPKKQNLILNVASNARKKFGPNDIDIEIVAFGPGLKILFAGNKNKDRIAGLAMSGVNFTACSNTIRNMTKKMAKAGKTLKLQEKSIHKKTPGVARILELVENGYTLVRP